MDTNIPSATSLPPAKDLSALSYPKETVSALTHFIATLLSIAGLTLLIIFASLRGTALHITAFTIFGAALLLLYLASTLYHFLSKDHRWKDYFRLLDHSMIYILIAGTYTPVTLLVLPSGWGWSLFGVIWGLALIGILKKTLWRFLPSWLSVGFYLVMGWLALIAINPLLKSLPLAGLLWLLLGGIFYTIGTIFFALDHRYQLKGWFTFHDIFHIFVMLGSFSHFWLMFRYVLPKT